MFLTCLAANLIESCFPDSLLFPHSRPTQSKYVTNMKKSIMHQITDVIRTILQVCRRHRRPKDLNMFLPVSGSKALLESGPQCYKCIFLFNSYIIVCMAKFKYLCLLRKSYKFFLVYMITSQY